MWSVKSRIGRAAWRTIEQRILPGMVCHWMRRKQVIDRIARSAAAEGFTQLVVIGAGLDTLAFRLDAEHAFARVLSGDHPATQRAIRRSVHDSASGVSLVEIDLTTDDAREAIVRSPAFDPAQPTLVLIEGVLMYLTQSTAANILRALSLLHTPRARLVVSWMLPPDNGVVGFRSQSGLVTRWLKRQSEPMLWGSTPTDVEQLLTDTGWRTLHFIDLSEPCEHNASAVRGLPDERIAIADRNSSIPQALFEVIAT